MKLRLTDLAIRKLVAPTSGQVTYWDESTPGFGLRCSQKSKSFVVMYGAKRRLKTLGRYPTLSVAEARKQAKQFQASQLTADPDLVEYSYQHTRDVYLDECGKRLRPSTLEGYSMYLHQITFSEPLHRISRGDVLKAIRDHTSSRSSQNYAFTTFKVFFNWAVRHQYLDTNPLASVGRPNQPTTRERVLSEHELATLLRHTFDRRNRYHDIVSLLALTGQRRGEIAALRWAEMDLNSLTLHPDRTKNKRQHWIPLGRTARQLIETIEGGNRFVFGTAMLDQPFNGWVRAHQRLLKETGLDHFTLHDLRRTYSTQHAQLGTPIHVTERLLNHVTGTISGVAAVYNRYSYQSEMRAAVAQYDEFVANLVAL